MAERLTIRVRRAGDRLGAVSIASTRSGVVASGLAGQPVERALSVLPLIFSLCGRAQASAAARAVEDALGLTPDPATVAARDLVVAAEALQELWMPVLMDWPPLTGAMPRVEDARRLRGALAPLWSGCDRAAVEAALAVASDFAPAVPATAAGGRALAAQEDGALGAFLRWIAAAGLEGFGAGPLAPLPAEAAVETRLAADGDGTFRRAPVWGEGPAETGALARHHRHPAVAAALAVHGAGLLARVLARAVDMADQCRRMHDSARALWQTGADRCSPQPQAVPADATGSGAGRAETARGTLVHWVDLADGRVRDWRILAPTEWNFHPQGPLARGLEGAPAGTAPETRVRLLAAVIDPCVACDVAVEA